MPTFRELLIKIGFETDEAPLKKIEERLEGIHHTLEFLAAAEVVKGVYELTERFAKFAEELHVSSVAANLTVEEFQKLAFAAEQSGISQGEMSMSMARLTRQLYLAKTGSSEAQQAFLNAGFTQDQIQHIQNGGQALSILADKFHATNDTIAKTGIGLQLLGRGSVQMIGFLSQGSAAIKGIGTEFENLGAVLTDKQVEALVSVEHSMNRLWAVMKALGATIATYLAPIFNAAIKDFLDFYKASHSLVEVNVKRWAEDLAYVLGFVHGLVQGVTKRFLEFASAHQTLVLRVFEVIAAFMAASVAIGVMMKAVGLAVSVYKLWQSVLSPVLFTFQKLWQALSFVTTAIQGVLPWLQAFATEMWEAVAPFTPLLAAVGLLIVAIHDLWEVAHGRPGWVNQFIEWLGIGDKVQAVFFAIFDVMSDIMNLDFSRLFKDLLGDAKAVGSAISGFFGGGTAGSIATGAIGGLLGVSGASAFGSSPTDTISALSSAPQGLGAGSGGAVSQSSYQVNAPVNITIPAGTDPKTVGDKVKEGIAQHLDTATRRMQQSFTPSRNY